MKQINNIEAEQVVLGSLLLDPKLGYFIALLNVDDFSDQLHRLLFEACEAIAMEGRHASPVVLAPRFAGQMIGSITVAQYLARLCTMGTTKQCMPDYIRALKDMSGRRMIGHMAEEMGRVASSHTLPLPEFIDNITKNCAQVMSGLRRREITSHSVGDLNKSLIGQLRKPGPSHLLPTGLRSLDESLGGFGRKELTIIGGRPGMGKTTLALSCMRQAAKQGVTSLFLSQEMGGAPVSARLLSDAVYNSQTPIPYKKMLRKTATDWEIERLEEVAEKMAGLPILVDEETSLTVPDVSVKARQYADQLQSEGKTLDMIWIDHLGYMQATDRYRGNKVYETGEITKGLRRLAKELNCGINLLCQLSRKVEERDDKRPTSSDLRDSGNIEEDADCCLLLYREAHYLMNAKCEDDSKEIARATKLEMMENIMEVIATKTRNGELFTRRVFTDIGSNVVRDLV